MLANQRKLVYISLISTNLPVFSTAETTAFLSQKGEDIFHLILSQQTLPHSISPFLAKEQDTPQGLIWLEISPYRVIMTMQGNGNLSYRHHWEKGVYGISRYWLNNPPPQKVQSFRLKNFTRSLQLNSNSLPQRLRIEYELWCAKLQLGCYILHLEIQH